MSIPKYDDLYEAVLTFLSDGNEHSSNEMTGQIADVFNLTPEERSEQFPSQRQTTIANRIGWARTYLKKAGLISSPRRGVFAITDLGTAALASGAKIDNSYLNQFDSFKLFSDRSFDHSDKTQTHSASPSSSSASESTPDETLGKALQLINKQLADALLDEIMKLSDKAFERFVLDLMNAMGYGAVDGATEQTPYSGDEGIDGIIMEDKLGFNLIYVQAKHYSPDHSVGRPEIQAFVGAIAGRNGKGLFVTTSKFSRPACDYANHQHIVLIDGEKLTQLMIEHGFGVSTRKVYKVQPIDTDLFNSYCDI